jgi:hypothetical protein
MMAQTPLKLSKIKVVTAVTTFTPGRRYNPHLYGSRLPQNNKVDDAEVKNCLMIF